MIYIKNLVLFTAISIFLLNSTVVAAPSKGGEQPQTPLEIANNLSKKLGQLQSLSFAFSQRTQGQLSGRTKQAGGKAYFARDERNTMMRWNYLAPDRQVIMSDGVELMMYFENLNQMIIAPADRLQQDVTYSFFTGGGNIEDQFIVSESDEIFEDTPDSPAYDVIRLEPRSAESQIKDIRLWVENLQQIRRIEIVDNFETKTTINISQIEENSLSSEAQLADMELFNFTPPEGTEIIRQ